MSSPALRIGIVGGGMLGLTLALRLAAAGHRVTVLEAGPTVGGLAGSQQVGGFTWDRFYHVILLSDLHLRGLLEELSLSDRLRWGQTRTGFFTDGQLRSLSSAPEFLAFPALSLADKARLGATILRAAHLRDWRELEGETAEAWLCRWSGRRTYQRLWLPLLRSKLGDNAPLASAAFIWAIIARMYSARRSGLKRELFGYVEGGYEAVLARFVAVLGGAGVELRCGSPVALVRDQGDGVEMVLPDGTVSFDRAVLTVPCSRIEAICPGLSAQERERLRRVVYQGVVCPSLLLRRPLGGYYVTNITDPGFPFTGVIEMTSLVDPATFGGHTLVYLPRYLTQQDPLWHASDADLVAAALGGLARMYPSLDRTAVVDAQVGRAREVLAVSTLHYSRDALPPLTTSLPNVYVVNSAQIAAGTLNNNETVGLADAQARALLPRLGAPRPVATGV